jgi:hemolysin activation/secretion protein
MTGNGDAGIKVRLIGGPDRDSIIDQSIAGHRRHKTEIYDNRDNYISAQKKDELHYTRDTSRYGYHYDTYTPDKSGLKPSIFYSNDDKIYLSLGYMVRKNQWRKYPFAYEHSVAAHYSITQSAFSFHYKGIINQLIGKWNVALNATYDQMIWTNFYGLGNESKFETTNLDYYRLRTREANAGAGIFRNLGKYHFVSFSAFYQNVKINNDPERFLAKNYNPSENVYNSKDFVGLQAEYNFSHTNDPVLPSKGFDFFATTAAVDNIKNRDSSFASISGSFNTYLPLSKKFIFVIRGGAATLAGHPEFYQYNWIGGSQRLRGYRRGRFYGKSAVNNNNELQWVNNVRSSIFNGKAGLLAFYDVGRVWMPGEESNTWHSGYGGGIIIAPFQKFSLSVTYGISSELHLFHVRFNKILF